MPRVGDEVLGKASVSVGVVGLGYWGPNYLRVLGELPQSDNTWVCDLDPGALDFAKDRHPRAHRTRDYDELLADPALDAVVVATPPETHTEIVEAALAAGKHVLCEKPLATTTEDCIQLERAALAGGRVLMVGHTYIFNPAVRLLRRYVAEGAIGRVRYIHSVRTGPGPVREGVNVLWDLAPHDIAMILYVVGEAPLEVAARGGAQSAAGHEGVVFACGKPYGEYREINRDGEILVPHVTSEEPLRMQVLHFLECCLYDLPPETGAEAATGVVDVLEAASRSLADDGLPVPAGAGVRSGRARTHTAG